LLGLATNTIAKLVSVFYFALFVAVVEVNISPNIIFTQKCLRKMLTQINVTNKYSLTELSFNIP